MASERRKKAVGFVRNRGTQAGRQRTAVAQAQLQATAAVGVVGVAASPLAAVALALGTTGAPAAQKLAAAAFGADPLLVASVEVLATA